MNNDNHQNKFKCNCKNCKHFIKYFVRHKGKFYATGYGQCNKRKIPYALRLEEAIDCSMWETAENEIENREKTVKVILKEIEEKLNNVKDILTYSMDKAN